MFGFGALASRAFTSLISAVTPTPTPSTWGEKVV